jgi:hypothetical protein
MMVGAFFSWSPPRVENSRTSNTAFQGKEKKISFGAYPDISLAEARQKRDQARALLASGIDPSDTRMAQKAAATEETESFEVIAREWHAKFSSSWAPSHSGKIIRRLELYIFPWLGARPIKEITAAELLSALRRIEAKGILEYTLPEKPNSRLQKYRLTEKGRQFVNQDS